MSKPAKPDKPYPEFPLFPHATGRWAKKVRGQFRYYGPWSDPQVAQVQNHRVARRRQLREVEPILTGPAARAN